MLAKAVKIISVVGQSSVHNSALRPFSRFGGLLGGGLLGTVRCFSQQKDQDRNDLPERIIKYQPSYLDDPADLVCAIRERRGGRLLNLDRMLLHSAPLARGWNQYLGEVRNNLLVDMKLRELVMCVVAVLNDAPYEFDHHAPIFKEAGGTEQQVEAIRSMVSCRNAPTDLKWHPPIKCIFNALEMATIELTVQMTLHVRVDQQLVVRLRELLAGSDQAVVELVAVVATYNMVSRFLVALDVTPDDINRDC